MKIKKQKGIRKNLGKFWIVSLILLFIFIIILLEKVILFSPSNNQVLTNRNPELKWFSRYNNYQLLIDNNPNFKTPIIEINLSKNNYKVQKNLDFSKYYWKVLAYNGKKWISSKPKTFTIISSVALEINKTEVKNVGNVQINLTIKEKKQGSWFTTGFFTLDVKQALKKQNNETLFIAEQI